MQKWKAWRVARKMLHNGESMAAVVRVTGYTAAEIDHGLAQLTAVIKASRVKEAQKKRSTHSRSPLEARIVFAPEMEPMTLSQLILGDPLPGRSALDRRRACTG